MAVVAVQVVVADSEAENTAILTASSALQEPEFFSCPLYSVLVAN